MQSQENILNANSLNKLISQQTIIVQQNAQEALDFSQKNGVDIFNIGDAIMHKYPLQWYKIKDNWKEIYKTMKININAQTKINRVYLLEEPIGAEHGN